MQLSAYYAIYFLILHAILTFMLANEIKRIRKLTGLIQKDFAKVINVSTRTLASYEKGETSPNAVTIGLIRKLEEESQKKKTASQKLDENAVKQIKDKFVDISSEELISYLKLEHIRLMDSIRYRKYITRVGYDYIKEIAAKGLE